MRRAPKYIRKRPEIAFASSVVISSAANAIQAHRLQHAPNGEARSEKDINSDRVKRCDVVFHNLNPIAAAITESWFCTLFSR